MLFAMPEIFLSIDRISPNCGCAAKVGASSLHEIMQNLPVSVSKTL